MTQSTDESNRISQVNTDGGPYIAGNVEAQEFVGRDKNVTIIQRLDPADARNQRNHKAMRQLVKSFWVDGVLKHSLYREVLIRLNLEKRPNAVDNQPWDLVLYQYGQPDNTLPRGISIVDVFDQMNQLLLILGEPGSGKTTMLLELADALLRRAEADPTHPTPVIFNLSSWAEKRQPLAEWLVEELLIKYSIRKEVGQQWISKDELLPLLDGLDEVQQDSRDDCLKVINQFRQEHLVSIAVCSRVIEYADLSTQLRLQGAILVQPLTLTQVDEYLNAAGSELSSVKTMLQLDAELQALATSPLMLNIMAFAYRGLSTREIAPNDSIQTSRHYLFTAYTKRMFAHRGIYHVYSVRKTLHWLIWLSSNMLQHQQTIFLIERIQPEWLQSYYQAWYYRLTHGLIHGLIAGLIFGLPAWLLAGMKTGLITGLIVVVIQGLIVGLSRDSEHIESEVQLEFDAIRLIRKLGEGLLFGLVVLLFSWLSISETNGLLVGLCLLPFCIILYLFIGLMYGLKTQKIFFTVYPNQGIWQSARNMLSIGLLFGLTFGLVGGLFSWLMAGLIVGLSVGSGVGMGFGLLLSLTKFGGFACIQHLVLRTLLWAYNYAPLNYARFLDYCVDRVFLRRVGGGYIFVHRLIMEHFASLTDEDIERIARDVEVKK